MEHIVVDDQQAKLISEATDHIEIRDARGGASGTWQKSSLTKNRHRQRMAHVKRSPIYDSAGCRTPARTQGVVCRYGFFSW